MSDKTGGIKRDYPEIQNQQSVVETIGMNTQSDCRRISGPHLAET